MVRGRAPWFLMLVGGMDMSRRTRCSQWRSVLIAAAVLAGGLMLVPAALADIVGTSADAGTKNAGLGGFKNGDGWTTNKHNVGNPPVISGASAQVSDDLSDEHNTVFYLSP